MSRLFGSRSLPCPPVPIPHCTRTRLLPPSHLAGYDLVNEPEPPTAADLVALYRRIIKAVRAVDTNHLVLLEGGGAPAPTATESLASN